MQYSSTAGRARAALRSSAWPTTPATASVWMGCAAKRAAARNASHSSLPLLQAKSFVPGPGARVMDPVVTSGSGSCALLHHCRCVQTSGSLLKQLVRCRGRAHWSTHRPAVTKETHAKSQINNNNKYNNNTLSGGKKIRRFLRFRGIAEKNAPREVKSGCHDWFVAGLYWQVLRGGDRAEGRQTAHAGQGPPFLSLPKAVSQMAGRKAGKGYPPSCS